MSGSLKFFLYTTNGGTNFAIRMDESNGEAIGNADVTDADLPLLGLPRNITPRYVLYRSGDGLHTRKIPVTANNIDLGALPPTFQIPNPLVGGVAITVVRQSLVGETQRPVISADTGQQDGDPT